MEGIIMRLSHFILFLILSVLVVASMVDAKGSTNEIQEEIQEEIHKEKQVEITVQEGDTLWNIAKPYYNGKEDYREYIYQIRRINNLKQAVIYPGQIIVIPVS